MILIKALEKQSINDPLNNSDEHSAYAASDAASIVDKPEDFNEI
jgi:hypothetical protein